MRGSQQNRAAATFLSRRIVKVRLEGCKLIYRKKALFVTAKYLTYSVDIETVMTVHGKA
jgi:hypothetical protein